MRSMKKLLQKAMVFTLTAAMLVGTPLTASAAPLNGAFSVEDHWGEKKDDSTNTRTGTVTNTTTSTETGVLKDNEIRILGIVLDKSHVDVVVGGEKETLTATVITDAAEGDLVNKFGEPATNEMMAQLYNMIKWQVLNPDGTVDASTNKVLTIGVVNKGDASQISLNPRQGTKPGEDMIVKASLDGTYYFTKDGVRTELTDHKTDGYSAEATVSIKEYSTGLAFAGVETEQYVKHTLDLSKYIVRTPETANDTITWSSDSKKATVTATGVVTFKSVTRDDEEITITAVSEKGVQASQGFTVSAGTPATKVEIVPGEGNPQLFASNNKKLNLDLGTDNDMWADASVKMYATLKSVKVDGEGKAVLRNGKPVYETKKNQPEGTPYNDLDADGNVVEKRLHITDVITWKTNKAAIADVVDSGDDWGTIEATGGAIGTAKITATASSGKNASVSVIVKASLTDLWIDGIENGATLYSGQSVQLTAGRWHPLNKDAVKWSIVKVGKSANPNATINNKGVLTVKPKLKLDSAYSDKVTIQLVTKANQKGTKIPVLSAQEIEITLEQSNIDSITVTDVTAKKVIAKAEYNAKKNKVVVNDGIKGKDNTTNISVDKGKNYTIAALTADNTSAAQTVDVKTSNAKVADVSYDRNGTARITGMAKGNATVTVSGVRDGKAIKTTFKVAVSQPTKTLTIDKPVVVLKATGKKQSVSFKAKQNKGAAEKITWSFLNDATYDGVTINSNNGKVTLAKDKYNAGDTYTVMAKSQSGVAATATIQIVTASAGVRVVDDAGAPFAYDAKKGKNGKKTVTNATVLALGGHVELFPEVNVGKASPANAQSWMPAGDYKDGKKAADVTYSVSKKGIVQIIGNTVYRVGNGSVKITIKTADGKKCTLTIDDIDKLFTE